MKKKTLIPLAIVFVLSMAAVAMAGGGYHNGYHNGGNWAALNQLAPEKQQLAQEIISKYETTFRTLKNEQWAKRTELDALVNSGKADKATIHAMVKDLSDVREKMFTTHQKMADELEQVTGLVVPGPGNGPRGMGMMQNGNRGMMQNGYGGCGNNQNPNCNPQQGCPRFN
ncbi:periplasmic heavy metal sensor [Desulfovibrio gilichinskyi]|uniref:Zinc resistance-associated protein n=1 Tax=Desulfovibrio gilichinskyi TaxID=1519643 RepID=A0A1X7CQ48_9BACT|nr:periplasmic heavy metal sensor [Desulfovibrio gilichinskyi]SMF00897.1 zinc resistance-associated protein [Desulfovibrio gilichinskyi]